MSKFNIVHGKCRNIIERTNGVLKNRWRCLLGARELYYTPKKAIQLTNICAALHNICISFKCQPVSVHLPDDDDACNLFNTESENHTQLSFAQRTRDRITSCF